MIFKIKDKNLEDAIANAKLIFAKEKLKVVAEIPTSKNLGEFGYAIKPLYQILFFRPDFLKFLIDAQDGSAMLAPLKLVIRENNDGHLEGVLPSVSESFAKFPKAERFVAEMDLQVFKVMSSLMEES